MASDLQGRGAELGSVLPAGVRERSGVSFVSLKRTLELPRFDPGHLGTPAAEPRWEQFAPRPPGTLGRMFGGRARAERDEGAPRATYEHELAKHAAAEAERRTRLAERRSVFDRQAADAAQAMAAHNAEIDQFERDFRAAEPEAVAQFFTLVLDASAYPDGFPHRTRALYRPEPGEVVVEYELPPQSVIPVDKDYKYMQTRDEIDAVARPVKEIKDEYARLIARWHYARSMRSSEPTRLE